ncbi:MAG TPA: hypothetical protein VLH86_06455 [Patescibacteria group bacterium]|nr:hypothetical protein [Patescibacteria group bacterium]
MADMQEVGGTLNTLFDPTCSPLATTLGVALAQAVETMEAAAAATDGSVHPEAAAMHERLQGVVRCLGEAANELVAAGQAKDALLAGWGLGLHASAPASNGVVAKVPGVQPTNMRQPERAAAKELLRGDGVDLLKRHLVGAYATRADLNIDMVGVVEVRDIYMVGRDGLMATAVTDIEGIERIAAELQEMFPDLPPLGSSADGEVAAALYDSLQDIPAPLVVGGLYYKLVNKDKVMTIEDFATHLNGQYAHASGHVYDDIIAARDLANRFVARFGRAKENLQADS